MNCKWILAFNLALSLNLLIFMVFIQGTKLVYAANQQEILDRPSASQQIISGVGDALESMTKNLENEVFNSMLLIIPDTKGKIYLCKTTDFTSDSTKFLTKTRPFKLNKLSSVLLEETQGDINKAYHLIVTAQENVPNTYISQVVNHYRESLKVFPEQNIDISKFHFTLFSSFKTLDELKGSKGSISE